MYEHKHQELSSIKKDENRSKKPFDNQVTEDVFLLEAYVQVNTLCCELYIIFPEYTFCLRARAGMSERSSAEVERWL